MIYNCAVSLTSISGASSNKTQGTPTTLVRAYIAPASNEVLVMYPELPIGQSFTFNFVDDSITVVPETEIKITNAFSGELAVNQIFVVSGVPKKNKLAGQIFISGVCVRKDN